jgi:hypothetical protein
MARATGINGFINPAGAIRDLMAEIFVDAISSHASTVE